MVVTTGLIVLAIVLLWVLFGWWVQRPMPRATLDRARFSLDQYFNGLIQFGLDTVSIALEDSVSKDRVCFTKRVDPSLGWNLEVSASGRGVSKEVLSCVSLGIGALGSKFLCRDLVVSSERRTLEFSLSGSGLEDAHALEGIARLITRCMGHPSDTKYEIRYEGPMDDEALYKYYGV